MTSSVDDREPPERTDTGRAGKRVSSPLQQAAARLMSRTDRTDCRCYAEAMGASRRSFLRRAGLAGGALLLPGGIHLATRRGPLPDRRRTDHYVILYLLVGGWDLMLVTDPIIRDGLHTPFGAADVVVAGGARLGPAMGPLLPFMDRLAILKGITVDALNHPQARMQMVTGRFQDPGGPVTSSIQALLARRSGDAYAIPNLSSDQLRPASFLGDGGAARLEPLRIASLDQLSHLTSAGDPGTHDAIARAVAALDRDAVDRHGAHGLSSRLSSSSSVAHGLIAGDEPGRIAASSSLLDEAHALLNVGGRVEQQVRLAVEAVRADLAPVVTLGTGEFDAHTGHDYAGHPGAVARALVAVADIANGLQDTVLPDGRTLLDMTTIVVTSEFSRAPSLNELGGKHHWPGNAMLFLGRGVRGRGEAPHIVGGVDDGLMPRPMNIENGSFGRGAEPIEMAHGLATILAMVGEDPLPLLGVEPLTRLIA